MRKLFFLLIIVCFLLLPSVAITTTTPTNDPDIANLLSFPEPLYFEILIQDCKLIAYKKIGQDEFEKIQEFPIATVAKGVTLYPIGKGFITGVELNPSWYPTENIVEHMNKKLVSRGEKPTFKKGMTIGPRDPRNAMGTFKMFLSHDVPGKGPIYRIHGTNAPDSIGKRASSGCNRMKNETGFPIAQNVKERIKKGQKIEVNIKMTKEG